MPRSVPPNSPNLNWERHWRDTDARSMSKPRVALCRLVQCERLTRKQITRTQHLITYRLIANTAFRSHAGQDRHSHVGIIINDHLTLDVVETMQTAGILSEG